jgi:hypothetical protein
MTASVHDGRLVLERYLGQMRAGTPHLLMSVSKSIVGCVYDGATVAAR